MGDLLTLAQYDLPIKVVVFNNSTLGMVKLEMDVATNPYELAMPPKVTKQQVLGVSLNPLKETLDGDLSEMKELINNVHR